MASYQVLDLQQASHNFPDDTRTMIDAFAMGLLKQLLEDYHKDMMAMDFNRLGVSSESLREAYCYVLYPDVKKILREDTRQAIQEKDEQRLIEMGDLKICN